MNKEVQVIISECAFIGDDWRVLKRKEEKSFHNYIAAKNMPIKRLRKVLVLSFALFTMRKIQKVNFSVNGGHSMAKLSQK